MNRIFKTPEDRKRVRNAADCCFPPSIVYDFEFCAGEDELRRLIHHINFSGYILISVTQDLSGIYTVFFRRLAV